ncbi:MAG TPA: 6-pyruvoyl-tetrahydropterin synthase-related protein, partial [Clostridia bacterium]
MQFNRLTHPLINKYFSALSVVFLFFLSLLMMFRQLTTPAYFSIVNNDAYSYSSWAFQLSNALREGIIYPRWMPLDFAGYGSPTFVYYPPLSFYIVAFFNIFTDSTTIAMNITRFLSLFLSGTGLFFLGKEIYSERSAAVAAVFYLLLPYNVMHFYLLGSFASSVSFMWFSPILLGSYKYVQTDQFKYLAYAGICYSGLILTHVINAYMFTFVVLAFIVFLFLTNRKWNYLFTGMLMLLAGVSLSAAYVLPLAYEKNLINVSGFLQGGSFYFAKCFIQPHMMDKAFVNLFWPFNYDTFAMFALVIFYCCIAFIFIISIY